MFLVSKFLSPLTQPLTWVALLLLLSLWWMPRRPVMARRVLLVGVDKTQHWLLVTSARHMPRALSAFRAAGWNVTPYPVDYLTSSETAWTEYSLANGTLRWQAVLREYFGWVAYSVTGRA